MKKYQNKILKSTFFILVAFTFSCIRFSPDCENQEPQIIVKDDSSSYNYYTIKNCLRQGMDYYVLKKDSIEELCFYKSGIKDGICVIVNNKDSLIELRRYSENKLLESKMFKQFYQDSVDK